MSLTPSTMLPLGTQAPDFKLPDVVTGKPVQLGDFYAKKGLLVMFICQHCPYVQHIKKELAKLSNGHTGEGTEGLLVVGLENEPRDIVAGGTECGDVNC